MTNEPQNTETGSQALKALLLRRLLDKGELTQQEYMKRLNPQQDGTDLKAQDSSFTNPITTSKASSQSEHAIVTTDGRAERFLAMKCLLCGAALHIYDHTQQVWCSECDTEIIVVRKDCTIELRAIENASRANAAEAAKASAVSSAMEAELTKLRAAAAMVTNVRRTAELFGGVCGCVFAYFGIADLAARHLLMGTGILFCGSALLCIVVRIARHTTKVRAQLTRRIGTLTQATKCGTLS
jgi:ribosomal protein S27E